MLVPLSCTALLCSAPLQVWAFARFGVLHAGLLTAACAKAIDIMHTMTPQSIANFVWSYATLEQAPPAEFLQSVITHALPTLASWAPQNLANTAWGLAALRENIAPPMLRVRDA